MQDVLTDHVDRLRFQVENVGTLPWFRNWRDFPICDWVNGKIILGLSSLFMRAAPYARMVLFEKDLKSCGKDLTAVAPLGYCPVIREGILDFNLMKPFFRAADLGLAGDRRAPTPTIGLKQLLKCQGYSLQEGPWKVEGTLLTLPAIEAATTLVAMAKHEWHRHSWKGDLGPWLLVGLLGPVLRYDLRHLSVPRSLLDGVSLDQYQADLGNALRLLGDLLPDEVLERFCADLIERPKDEGLTAPHTPETKSLDF